MRSLQSDLGHLALLRTDGFEMTEVRTPFSKLRALAPSLRFHGVESSGMRFVISDRCREQKTEARATGFSTVSNEFILHADEGIERAFEILNYLVYFHLTLRFVNYDQLLDLGRSLKSEGKYQYVYTSLPFFLTEDYSRYSCDRDLCQLVWGQGVLPAEADYIRKFGGDTFARKFHSGNAYIFRNRDNADYLLD